MMESTDAASAPTLLNRNTAKKNSGEGEEILPNTWRASVNPHRLSGHITETKDDDESKSGFKPLSSTSTRRLSIRQSPMAIPTSNVSPTITPRSNNDNLNMAISPPKNSTLLQQSLRTSHTTITNNNNGTVSPIVGSPPSNITTPLTYSNANYSPLAISSPATTPSTRPHASKELFNFFTTSHGSNFIEFLIDGSFSDVTLQLSNGSTYYAHRLILGYASDYFYQLFTEHPQQSIFTLNIDDPDCLFPNILQFLYGGGISINQDNAIGVLVIAETFHISELKTVVSQFLISSIRMNNAIDMLRKAIKYDTPEMISRCVYIIAKHFRYIDESELCSLSYKTFLSIIKQDHLNVKDEHLLYRVVCKYIESNFPWLWNSSNGQLNDLSTSISSHERGAELVDEIQELFRYVRYRFMTFQQLSDVIHNPLVPQDLVIEAGMMRLAAFEAPSHLESLSSPRLAPRARTSITIEFSREDLVGKGIVHWIGTNCGRDQWQDPTLRGVKVTASSVERGNPLDLVRKLPQTELWTKDVPSSYFKIDFGQGRQIIPSYYTLVHGGNYEADILRNWCFQGSNEGEENWTTLTKHPNDDSLTGKFVPHSWPVDGVSKAYRFFRILQTGHNSSNRNFLVLCGFEIYGELFEE